MQISALDYSSYVGIIGLGRIFRGSVSVGQVVSVVGADGQVRKGKVLQLMINHGIERHQVETASAGNIICIAGLDDLKISDSLCDPECIEKLPALTVDEPTISMNFVTNQSPFAGKDGDYVTSRQLLRDRLQQELLHNVALRVEETESADQFLVSGRGELHLAILIETMRREGYELAVSRPHVIQKEIDGVLCEPYETVQLDIEENDQGCYGGDG